MVFLTWDTFTTMDCLSSVRGICSKKGPQKVNPGHTDPRFLVDSDTDSSRCL